MGKTFEEYCSAPAQTRCQALLIRAQLFMLLRMSVISAEMGCEASKGELCAALEVKSKEQMSYNAETCCKLLCSTRLQINRFIRHTLRSIYSQCQKIIHICHPFFSLLTKEHTSQLRNRGSTVYLSPRLEVQTP